MPVNLRSLRIVIEHAERQRDSAGVAVAHAMRELGSAQLQLRQLTDYASDGEVKWRARAAEGVSVPLLQHQRAFVEKIQQAVDFQGNVIQQKEANLARANANLQAKEQTLATLKKVAERAAQAKAMAEYKREQKLTDEMAMSMLAFQRREQEQEALT